MEYMRSFDPKELETARLHGLLLSAVSPRPIAFASTIDATGRPNLAPFSFFNVFSANPPIAVFSPARRVKGNTTKHTLQNVESTKEVVINVVNHDLLYQMNLASSEYPEGVNEFGKTGLTPIASLKVKPFRVKESPVQLECKVREVVKLGADGGAGNLVVCEVVMMHFSEAVFTKEGTVNPHKLDLMARMGGDWYCRASGSAIFEVPKPGRELGIGVDAMPENIRESHTLSGNDLGLLGGVAQLPTKEEVARFREQPSISKLLKFMEKNPSDVRKQLHQNAQGLLLSGRIDDAWKVLLAAEDY